VSTPLIIEPSPELRSLLDERARQSGKSAAEIAREILEESVNRASTEDADQTRADFEAGLADLAEGRTFPARQVFAELRARHELSR